MSAPWTQPTWIEAAPLGPVLRDFLGLSQATDLRFAMSKWHNRHSLEDVTQIWKPIKTISAKSTILPGLALKKCFCRKPLSTEFLTGQFLLPEMSPNWARLSAEGFVHPKTLYPNFAGCIRVMIYIYIRIYIYMYTCMGYTFPTHSISHSGQMCLSVCSPRNRCSPKFSISTTLRRCGVWGGVNFQGIQKHGAKCLEMLS